MVSKIVFSYDNSRKKDIGKEVDKYLDLFFRKEG